MTKEKRSGSGGLVVGIGIGLAIGVVGTSLVGGVLGYLYFDKMTHDARLGWNLMPVVVAARDIEPNTVIQFDDLASRQVPEQFATDSVVKPDSVDDVLNQKLVAPVRKGDPILWTHLNVKPAATKPSGTTP